MDAPACSAPFFCGVVFAIFLQGMHAVGRRFRGEGVCAAEVLNLNGSNPLCHQRAPEALRRRDPTCSLNPEAGVYASSQMGSSSFIESQTFMLHYHPSCC